MNRSPVMTKTRVAPEATSDGPGLLLMQPAEIRAAMNRRRRLRWLGVTLFLRDRAGAVGLGHGGRHQVGVGAGRLGRPFEEGPSLALGALYLR